MNKLSFKNLIIIYLLILIPGLVYCAIDSKSDTIILESTDDYPYNGWENEPEQGDTLWITNEGIEYIIYDISSKDSCYIVYSNADINCLNTKIMISKKELGILLSLSEDEEIPVIYKKE